MPSIAIGAFPMEYSVQFLSFIPFTQFRPNTIPMKYRSISEFPCRATNHHGKRYPRILISNAVVENHKIIKYRFLHLMFPVYS